jgi:hypothetical protein
MSHNGFELALETLKKEYTLLPFFSSSFKFLELERPRLLGLLGQPFTENEDFLLWAE